MAQLYVHVATPNFPLAFPNRGSRYNPSHIKCSSLRSALGTSGDIRPFEGSIVKDGRLLGLSLCPRYPVLLPLQSLSKLKCLWLWTLSMLFVLQGLACLDKGSKTSNWRSTPLLSLSCSASLSRVASNSEQLQPKTIMVTTYPKWHILA